MEDLRSALAEEAACTEPMGYPERVIRACTELELQITRLSTDHRAIMYAVHILTCLRTGDREGARMVWLRIADKLKSGHKELHSAWELTQALWDRDFPKFFTLVVARSWSGSVRPCVERLVGVTRQKLLDQYCKMYSCMTVASLSESLGMSPTEAASFVESAGWVPQGGSKSSYAPVAERATSKTVVDLSDVRALTEHVLALERKPLSD